MIRKLQPATELQRRWCSWSNRSPSSEKGSNQLGNNPENCSLWFFERLCWFAGKIQSIFISHWASQRFCSFSLSEFARKNNLWSHFSKFWSDHRSTNFVIMIFLIKNSFYSAKMSVVLCLRCMLARCCSSPPFGFAPPAISWRVSHNLFKYFRTHQFCRFQRIIRSNQV